MTVFTQNVTQKCIKTVISYFNNKQLLYIFLTLQRRKYNFPQRNEEPTLAVIDKANHNLSIAIFQVWVACSAGANFSNNVYMYIVNTLLNGKYLMSIHTAK